MLSVMLLEVRHNLRYDYAVPVTFDPTVLRLKPRTDATQRLVEFQLTIDPLPGGQSECVDVDGNDTVEMWFTGKHRSLEFNIHSVVETFRVNPYDFMVSTNGATLPMAYDQPFLVALAVYRIRESPSDEVDALAQEIVTANDHQTLPTLTALCQALYERVTNDLRSMGDPMTPSQTLQLGQGACRDKAVLFMDACRTMGLAARFVSGYVHSPPQETPTGVIDHAQYLHAWAEVYIPGGGWRGYDPTNGLAVADHHVAVAAAPYPFLAGTTHGVFRGTDGSSTLTSTVQVDAVRSMV
ncbi:MAG: transglutaminase family protein [Phycisphaera sp.]|nr:transglutaminase family protein [Phycisphaera sp.]